MVMILFLLLVREYASMAIKCSPGGITNRINVNFNKVSKNETYLKLSQKKRREEKGRNTYSMKNNHILGRYLTIR